MTVDLKINKSDWNKAKLGDLVEEVNDRVANPSESEFDRFVGLGDFVSGDLKIKSWSSTESLSSSAKAFKKGDILFARRNAYLRRASMVDFEGCCSGDAFVLREKKDKVVPGFLAFIVNSNDLWNYANSNAAGTMSKRVKWRDLAKYEFLLPPLDQQKQLAKLLWAMDEVIEKEKEVRDKLDVLFKSKIKFISYNEIHQNGLRKIKDICDIKDNLRKPLNSGQRNKMKGEIPYYGANGIVDFIDSYIFNEDLVLLAEDGGNFMEFYEKPIAYKIKGKSWVNNHAHVLSPKTNELSTDWLYYSLIHKNITKYIIGTTRLKLNKSELERIEIWVPEKQTQNKLEKEITRVYQAIKISDSKIHSSEQLLRSLIHQIF